VVRGRVGTVRGRVGTNLRDKAGTLHDGQCIASRMDADAKPPLLATMLALLPAMRTRGCLVTRKSPVLLPSLKATITTSTARNMSKPAPGHKDATYHTECTGQALETVKAHSSPSELTLFGACFCPFVHRVWIALEYLQGELPVIRTERAWDTHTDRP
jgi:hypothetical protein